MKSHNPHIHCLSLTFQSSSVAKRERIAFTPHRLDTSLEEFVNDPERTWDDIQGLVILSTCNRVEIYAVSNHPIFDLLERFIADVQDIDISAYSSDFSRYLDEGAVFHLFRVACGLESAVLGEPQILGQVTNAYMIAKQHGSVGKNLERLFQTAIFTGKRVRSETQIGHKPASIASLAVKLISEKVESLSEAQIVLLGAGEMAELSIEALRKRGAEDILVINRTYKMAQELAERWNGQAASMQALPKALKNADILIASTGAPHIIVEDALIEKAIESRPHRPLVIMDIAVPRDIDARANQIPGVYLYDIDSLSEKFQTCITQRKSEIPKVETIIEEEVRQYQDYLSSLDMIPIIVNMRKQANLIRQDELQKTIQHISNLSPETEEQIEILTKSIVNKILHIPTIRLKEEASGPNAAEYADMARDLFGLNQSMRT